MTNPAQCHCGSISWERKIEETRFICCSCKRPLWQPMETAPKTGVTILVYGHWPIFPSVPDIAFVYWDDDDKWWAFDGEEMNATHWMHLPEPPRT
jgi:dissimilatory sulfite reductase (desulfoviridin) alpha/beta subunit